MKKVNIDNWILEQHCCETCGKIMTEYYASGRFCSKACACSFSTKNKREIINKKVSDKLKGRNVDLSDKQKQQLDRLHREILPEIAKRKRENTFVKCNGDILDITVAELERYRKTHTVCDICGNPETVQQKGKVKRLSVDHDHSNNHFRGLVCNHCNTKLGWLDKYYDTIIDYVTN